MNHRDAIAPHPNPSLPRGFLRSLSGEGLSETSALLHSRLTRAQFLHLMLGGVVTAALPRQARATGTYDFHFTRLKYDSGDWDVDARMPSNLITSLIDYTTLRVDPK